MKSLLITLAVAAIVWIPTLTMAAQPKEFSLVIKNHRFEPTELIVPVGEKIKLVVDNQDPAPEEFESYDLNREKIIGGGKKGIVFIGPLKKGEYKIFGEFNPKAAQGIIKAE